ncbi:MAG: Gfo/Idh/MocA family oxidoreductase [Tannerellaceae bacterium]|nr:Gfo/Idh/MocA family oxidoreductase [Tannerellaceae bacterium]
METINWGIIGCGAVCEWKSGPAFYKTPYSSLVAVMRRDEEKVKDFASRHNVPRYYTDVDALIQDPEVNAVYIATPPNTHKEYAIRVMQAGKPVYVEKPMALTYTECREMVEVSQATGQKLFVAHYRRGQDYFLKIKELIEQGRIGKLVSVNIRYFRSAGENDKNPALHPWRVKKEQAGGGYFFDLAPHTIDIVMYLAGNIQEAKAYVTNRSGYYEVEDTLSVAFRFENGAVGTGIWSFVTGGKERGDQIEFWGTKGKITCSTFAYDPIRLETEEGIELFPVAPPEHAQGPLIQSIVNELRGVGNCPSTGQSTLQTARIMDQIMEGYY